MRRILSVLAVLVFLSGCLTERKATRKLMKINAVQPRVVANACSRLFPPVAYTRDSIVYKPGLPTGVAYVYADCDSAGKGIAEKIKIPCPPLRITDTLILYKESQVVNRAAEDALREDLDACNLSKAEVIKERQILFWGLTALLFFMLIRWIIRGIKNKFF